MPIRAFKKSDQVYTLSIAEQCCIWVITSNYDKASPTFHIIWEDAYGDAGSKMHLTFLEFKEELNKLAKIYE